MASTIYLVRHGETDWNRHQRIQGQSDTPLNDVGRDQARLLGQRLSDVRFDLAFASDLRRAVETAELILGHRSLAVQTHVGLRERAFGEWEGGTAEEVSRSHPERWAAWRTFAPDVSPPGGENRIELAARVTTVLDQIARDNRGQTILVVSHGGAIQASIWSWFGVDVRGMANCTGYIVHLAGDERRLGEQI